MANQSSGKDNMDSTLCTLFAKLSFFTVSESDSLIYTLMHKERGINSWLNDKCK